MSYCKGVITRVTQHGGCLEVTVAGESPGVFAIDNCCVWAIVDTEGADWIGQPVEYVDGHMRFPDSREVEEADDCSLPSAIPFSQVSHP